MERPIAAFAAALLVAATHASVADAQQSFRLQSEPGAVLAYSAELDIRSTERWRSSHGEVDWDRLIRPTGTITNRGATALTVHLFALPTDHRSLRLLAESSDGLRIPTPVRSTPQRAVERAGETLLNTGSREAPLLMEILLRPGQQTDLAVLPVHDADAIGRMMAAGAVRLGILAVAAPARDGHPAPADAALARFDMPLRPEAFVGNLPHQTEPEGWFPGETWFPGQTWFRAVPVGNTTFVPR